MKNILIDCSTLSRKTDGLTQYTLSIVIEFLKNTSDKYTLLCRRNELPRNYISQLMAFGDRCAIEYADIATIGPKRDLQFRKWYRKNKIRFDAFYEPSAQYPAGVKGGLYTVHDILYEAFPEKLGKHSLLKKLFLHHVVRRGIKKSHSVVSVSEYTKTEILKYHKCVCLAEKIRVVHEGYEHLNNIVINNEDEFVKELLNFREKFFLYIGSSRGHKNLHNLFLGYKKSGIDWKLVIVGRMDRLEESDKELVETINRKKERIVFTGWIDDSQMYTILSHANAFVFPSKSEGFGIPILESYYFNVPLLCSDIPVFNEVAGNACIKFNPFDIDDIANCFTNFRNLKDEELEDLLQKQREQLALYSWKSAAKKIYSLLSRDDIKSGKKISDESNVAGDIYGGGITD